MKWLVSIFILSLSILGLSVFLLNSKPQSIGLYWMPYCPYGLHALSTMLAVGGDQDSLPELFYIAIDKTIPIPKNQKGVSVNGQGCNSPLVTIDKDSQSDRFTSLHGREEVMEGMRQVAIGKKWPSSLKHYLQRFVSNPNEEWKNRCNACGIDSMELERIVASEQGIKWYADNIQHAREKGITFSPTLLVNGRLIGPFPYDSAELKELFCLQGVFKDNCAGILCSKNAVCPPRQGFISECKLGRCIYLKEPLRSDAIDAYLIMPRTSVLCRAYPISEALKSWESYFKVEELDLETEKAQQLLRQSQVESFPVLVFDRTNLVNRPWGQKCIDDLHLSGGAQTIIVSLAWSDISFETYGHIRRTQSGIVTVIDHYAEAALLHQMNLFTEAMTAYRLDLTNDPQDYRAWNNLGALCYDVKNSKQIGGAMFEKALSLNGAYEPALVNLIRYYSDYNNVDQLNQVKDKLAWLLINKKEFAEASIIFKSLATNKRLEFSSRKGLAFIALKENRLDAALEDLNRCLEINAQPDGDFDNLLAGIYFRKGQRDKAISWYLRALATTPPSKDAYPNLCYLLSVSENWSQLLTISISALKAFSGNIDFQFYEAQALRHLDHTEEAIVLLKKLSTSSPEAEFRASYELSLLYADEKNRKLSLKYAQNFVYTVAIQPQTKLRKECLAVGNLALNFNDYKIASQGFEQVLRVEPSSVVAHKQLAICYQKMGFAKQATEQEILAKEFGGNVQ